MSSLSLFYVVRNSALLGAICHASTQGVEFELYMYHFLVTYTAAFIGLVTTSVLGANQSLSTALLRASIAFTGFNAGALISIAVYRLLIHRCRKFDGPVLAKLTRFYATYLNAKDRQYSKELGKLHKRYGSIVRIGNLDQTPYYSPRLTSVPGPRELSILDKAALPVIYGPNAACGKSTWYGQNGNDKNKVSINMTRDPKQYRTRRRAWDRGLSIKGRLLDVPVET
jgi:hypothetical protein